MQSGVSTTRLAAIIQAALTGSYAYDNRSFGIAVLACAKRMCRARAPDLPGDLIEDVAQEAVANLFGAGPDALGSAPPLNVLRRSVLAAIRKIRANYASPGQRTRRYREEPRYRVAAEDVGRIPDVEALAAATIDDRDHSYLDIDRFPCPGAERAVAEAEQRITINVALAKVPPNIAQALRLIHLDEQPMVDVAMLTGISRFVLHRRIDQHCAMFREAA